MESAFNVECVHLGGMRYDQAMKALEQLYVTIVLKQSFIMIVYYGISLLFKTIF